MMIQVTMHGALLVDEILRVLFCYCLPEPHLASGSGADLVALATTCKAFKEPALDVLWAELRNPTALVRCLPQVCRSKDASSGGLTYMFKRRLKACEREAVKRYTRRIRSLNILPPGASSFDPKSLVDLYQPSLADPFFPNLSRLDFVAMDQTFPLIHHMASPKLKWLYVHSMTTNITWSYETFFHSLGFNCPNMESIEISGSANFSSEFNHIVTRQIRSWNRLRSMIWPHVSLDADTLVHLSQMHDLSVLSFTLGHTSMERIKSTNQLLAFSTLRELRVKTESINTASELFTRMLLPAATYISVFCNTTPPRHAMKSFSMALARLSSSDLSKLSLTQLSTSFTFEDVGHIALTSDDIRPLMISNLTQISIQVDWIIELQDSDLLELTSSCPRVSSLVINDMSGWRSPGITPAGLAQIFQKSPSLGCVCVALDTRGYTHPLRPQTADSWSIFSLNVNVVDSVIQRESVPALAAFLRDLMFGRDVCLSSWGTHYMRRHNPDSEVYRERWKAVERLAKQMVAERHARVIN